MSSVLPMFRMGKLTSIYLSCVIASIVRLYYTVQFRNNVNAGNISSTYNVVELGCRLTQRVVTNLSIWARVESACTIIAACLPSHAALFKEISFRSGFLSSLRALFTFPSKRSSKGGIDEERIVDVENKAFSGDSNTTRRGYHELGPVRSSSSNSTQQYHGI